MRNLRKSTSGLVGLVLILAMVGSYGVLAQEKDEAPETSVNETFTDWGRATRTIIPSSTEGSWDGTWYYVSRDVIIALWFQTLDGVPQIKLQYRSRSSQEGFVTDWDGNAEYTFRNADGEFSMNIERRDADIITGQWEWTLDIDKSARITIGDYTIYRAGDGRFLVLDFDNYTRRLKRESGPDELVKGDPSWTFTKASKRLVLWDELPF